MGFAIVFATTATGFCEGTKSLPKGFVYLEEMIPNIKIQLQYLTDENFMGRPIDGYVRPRCILTREAAKGLKKVQEELNPFGLGLKIYDAYRPQRAVNHFVRWAKDPYDTKMKDIYYPHVNKRELFARGYIASRSSHSRGSTVDLTIVSIQQSDESAEIDMGTKFDLFDTKSWPDSPYMCANQRAHRLLLQTLMKKHGFKPYGKEWWHFTLEKEPYPHTYFDFLVE
jgi:D-alanyl-D-alanine dipeptidase